VSTSSVISACWRLMHHDVKISGARIRTHDLWIRKRVCYALHHGAPFQTLDTCISLIEAIRWPRFRCETCWLHVVIRMRINWFTIAFFYSSFASVMSVNTHEAGRTRSQLLWWLSTLQSPGSRTSEARRSLSVPSTRQSSPSASRSRIERRLIRTKPTQRGRRSIRDWAWVTWWPPKRQRTDWYESESFQTLSSLGPGINRVVYIVYRFGFSYSNMGDQWRGWDWIRVLRFFPVC